MALERRGRRAATAYELLAASVTLGQRRAATGRGQRSRGPAGGEGGTRARPAGHDARAMNCGHALSKCHALPK